MYQASGRYRLCFFAPIMTAFLLWILRVIYREKFDEVLFSSRDGYLVYKLYSKMCRKWDLDLPKGIYFYTSRKLAMLSGFPDEKIEMACSTAIYRKTGTSDV